MSPEPDRDLEYLRLCIQAVEAQYGTTTYPLAAAVVLGNEVLAVRTSRLPGAPDPSAHPEMDAVRAAAERVGSRYLPGAVLYSTVEPCPMCTSVAIWAKMERIAFGASQEDVLAFAARRGTESLTWRQIRIPASAVVTAGTPRLSVTGGILREECLRLLELTAERSGHGRTPS